LGTFFWVVFFKVAFLGWNFSLDPSQYNSLPADNNTFIFIVTLFVFIVILFFFAFFVFINFTKTWIIPRILSVKKMKFVTQLPLPSRHEIFCM